MRALVMATMLLASADIVFAQDFEPDAEIDGLQLRLEGGDGRFTERSWDVGVMNELHATLSMTRLGYHREWAPAGRVALAAGDDANPEFLIIHVGQIADMLLPLEIAVTHNVGEKPNEPMIVGFVDMAAPVELSMHWDACRRVTIEIDGKRLEVQLNTPVRRIAVSASTGDLLVEPFSAGRRESPDADICALVS